MPIISKYTNEQFESMMNEIKVLLENRSVSPELSLMLLGNLATHILNQDIAPSQRKTMAENFAKALISSV